MLDTIMIPCPICGAPAGAVCRAAGRVGAPVLRYADHPGRVVAAQVAAIARRKAARDERAAAIAKLGWEPESPTARRDGTDYAADTGELVRWASEVA